MKELLIAGMVMLSMPVGWVLINKICDKIGKLIDFAKKS